MPLPLESIIMNEIGFGAPYNYFNGSGSCEYRRQEAARLIASAIQAHADAGEEIAPPYRPLIAAVQHAATSLDHGRYTLSKTWEVASYVIATHIKGYHDPDVLSEMVHKLRNHYHQPRVRRGRH